MDDHLQAECPLLELATMSRPDGPLHVSVHEIKCPTCLLHIKVKLISSGVVREDDNYDDGEYYDDD